MRYLTHHLVQASAEAHPQREALVFGSTRLDYHSVWSQMCGLASGLREAGLRRYDRVGVLLSPSPEQAISVFGVAAAGSVFVPIHHSWSAKQVAHVVNDCRMQALITTAKTWESLLNSGHSMPSLRSISLVDADGADLDHHFVDYRACIASNSDIPRVTGIGRDLAAILYTSGSTGLPKGVMLSHDNVLAGTEIVATYLDLEDLDRILSVLPFSFDAGLNQLTTVFARGGTLVMTKFLFPGEICSLLHSERITGLAGVPTFWTLLANHRKFTVSEFPHLRYITNTGGALPISTLQKLRARLTNTRIFLMYGLTEAFRSTYLEPDQLDARPTSIGKAIPNTEILVVDKQGRRCAAGEVGELVHDGPTVSLGYWERPELNARVFRPHPLLPPGRAADDRVCYSGDLVKMDEEGFLYFVGRRDQQIKTSGYRVSRSEIEAALVADESVATAAVVGIPDQLLGQRVIAFVTPSGAEVDDAQVLESCAKSLPAYMVPKECVTLDAVPLTASGKVDYTQLQRMAEDGSRGAPTEGHATESPQLSQ